MDSPAEEGVERRIVPSAKPEARRLPEGDMEREVHSEFIGAVVVSDTLGVG